MTSHAHHTDQELFCQIAAGREAAFRALFDRFRQRIYHAAFKMTRSADHAEETVQEVFVRLWLNRLQLASVQHPPAYLFTIAFHCISGQMKKLARERLYLQQLHQDSIRADGPEDRLLQKENQEMLENVLTLLPPRQQLIFRMSKQDELSRAEIAKRLHISPHTVRNHLQEAIKFIRGNMEKLIPALAGLFGS